MKEPCLADASLKPKVECSVVTEFTDHICVTMDAELIMFLHDLVSAYLKEKEKGVRGRGFSFKLQERQLAVCHLCGLSWAECMRRTCLLPL